MISGNVSLYNETRGEAIYPTPIIGALGLTEHIEARCTAGFKDEGDAVFLVGDAGQDVACLGGSEYLALVHERVEGRPRIDLDLEARLQRLLLDAIGQGKLKSAHDCADGGLAVTIAESSLIGDVGFAGGWPLGERVDASLFGEVQSRVVVSLADEDVAWLSEAASNADVPILRLGKVGGRRFAIDGALDVSLEDAAQAWWEGLS